MDVLPHQHLHRHATADICGRSLRKRRLQLQDLHPRPARLGQGHRQHPSLHPLDRSYPVLQANLLQFINIIEVR